MHTPLVGRGKFWSISLNKTMLLVKDMHVFLPTLTVNSNLFPIRVTEMRCLSVSECLNLALKLPSLRVIYQHPDRKNSLRPQTWVSNCIIIFRTHVYITNRATVRTVVYTNRSPRSDTFINNSPSQQTGKHQAWNTLPNPYCHTHGYVDSGVRECHAV
jgi:hypothetical protein